jgi:hypothetical protein
VPQPRTARPAQWAEGTQEFRFCELTFTIPASWSVRRADRLPFRVERVTVTGSPSGPRLTFSDTMQYVNEIGVAAIPQAGPAARERSAGGLLCHPGKREATGVGLE